MNGGNQLLYERDAGEDSDCMCGCDLVTCPKCQAEGCPECDRCDCPPEQG